MPDKVLRKVFTGPIPGEVEKSGEVRVVGKGVYAPILGETERAFDLHILDRINDAVPEYILSVVVPYP